MQTLAGALQGSGSVGVNSGTLVLGTANPMVGVTTLSGGTLQVNNALALEGQTLTLNGGGTLNYGGLASLTLGGLAGTQNWSAPATLTVGGNGLSSTYSGNLSGATSLTMTGPGSLYLGGANNSLASVLVSGGVLEVATTASLPIYNTSGAVSVAGGGVFAVQTGDGLSTGWSNVQILSVMNKVSWANNAALGLDTSNGNATYSGNIPASGSSGMGLAKLGANALTLAGSTNFSGPMTVSGGTLNFLAASNSIGALFGGGRRGAGQRCHQRRDHPDHQQRQQQHLLRRDRGGNSGGNAGRPGQDRSCALTLTGSNSYTSGTTVKQGVLNASVVGLGSGPLNLAGGTFQPGGGGLSASYYSLAAQNYITSTSLATFKGTYLAAANATLKYSDNIAVNANPNNNPRGFDFGTAAPASRAL